MKQCIECKQNTLNYVKCDGLTIISPLALCPHTKEVYEDESVDGDYEPQDGEIRCLECAFEYEYRERERVWSKGQPALLKKYKAQLDKRREAI